MKNQVQKQFIKMVPDLVLLEVQFVQFHTKTKTFSKDNFFADFVCYKVIHLKADLDLMLFKFDP
jgi:hypothetical protein